MKNANSLRKDIGLFLRKSRKEKSLTASQLGHLVKISQQQVSRYELGVTTINIEMLDAFLNVLDKSWLDFLFSVMTDYSDDIKDLNEFHY